MAGFASEEATNPETVRRKGHTQGSADRPVETDFLLVYITLLYYVQGTNMYGQILEMQLYTLLLYAGPSQPETIF